MQTIDPGHIYHLAHLDGPDREELVFVKRKGANYPENVGSHPGTNLQEVMRALIDRCKYLTSQAMRLGDTQTVEEDGDVIDRLRDCILILEQRAARRHGRKLELNPAEIAFIETLATCPKCGHIKPETHSHG